MRQPSGTGWNWLELDGWLAGTGWNWLELAGAPLGRQNGPKREEVRVTGNVLEPPWAQPMLQRRLWRHFILGATWPMKGSILE